MAVIPGALPWHRPQWAATAAWLAAERLPHAILLAGRPGVGKGLFAERLARVLLCERPGPEGVPCGACRACRLLDAGTHPDLFRLEPEAPGKPIRVDQVRDLVSSLALRSAGGGRRVALLRPAEAMNRYAANSLLKTLEEPPGAAVLILVSHAPGQLPATIRSRCQRLGFPTPPAGTALPWLASGLPAGADPSALLALSGGAPLAALELAQSGALEAQEQVARDVEALLGAGADPLQVAEGWRRYGLANICRWCYGVAAARVRRWASADRGGPHATAPPPARLFAVMDYCVAARGALEQGVSLNEQLALDGLAAAWKGAEPEDGVSSGMA